MLRERLIILGNFVNFRNLIEIYDFDPRLLTHIAGPQDLYKLNKLDGLQLVRAHGWDKLDRDFLQDVFDMCEKKNITVVDKPLF